MTRRTGVCGLMAFAVMVAACGKKKEPETPVPVTPTPTTETRDTAAERIARARADSIARADADRRTRETASIAARTTLQEIVYFEYDLADIRTDMQDVLDRKAAVLRANPNVTLRIDGHADERGTVEYNLVLSLRRANAAREYLTGAGIAVTRLEVTGFGEERLADPDTDESAHARNRRAEFQITRGGDNLVPAR